MPSRHGPCLGRSPGAHSGGAGPASDQSTWQSAFQQAKADHDFTEQELELKTNTQLTREIHTLTTELHRRLLKDPAQ